MRAVSAFEKALELEPDYAPAWAAMAKAVHRVADFAKTSAEVAEGFDRALAAAERAVALDPADPNGHRDFARHLLAPLRALDEAIAHVRKAIELDPLSPRAWGSLGPAEALQASERSTEEIFRLRVAALAHHDLCDDAGSRRALDGLIEKCATHAAVQVASVFAWRGEVEQAFARIDRAMVQRDSGLPDITVDPLFRRVRDDARYEAALRALNLHATCSAV